MTARLVLAALASCALYLLPLFLPHAVLPVGVWLVRYGTHAGALAVPTWGAMLGLQALFGALLHWTFGRLWPWRWLALVPAVPVVFVAMNALVLVVIPGRILVAREPPGRGEWPVVCSIDGWLLRDELEEAAVVPPDPPGLYLHDGKGGHALLRADAGCEPVRLEHPRLGLESAPLWLGEGGRAILRQVDRGRGVARGVYVPASDGAAVPLPPCRSDGLPCVSRDGAWVGWVERPGQVVVRAIHGWDGVRASDRSGAIPGVQYVVPVAGAGAGHDLELLDVDVERDEILLAIDYTRFVVVGLDGAVRAGPVTPEGVGLVPGGFQRVAEGWLAWSSGVSDEPEDTVVWSLPAGRGRYRMADGRRLEHVSADPGATLIVVVTGPRLRVGNAQRAITVLRASDGQEIFRLAFPPRQSVVAKFLDRRRLAYGATWPAAGEAPTIRVLEIPAEGVR